MTTPPDAPEMISCEEARQRLGMGRDAFYEAVAQNLIPGFFKSGGRYYGVRAPFERVVVAGDPLPGQAPERTPTAIPFLTQRRTA